MIHLVSIYSDAYNRLGEYNHFFSQSLCYFLSFGLLSSGSSDSSQGNGSLHIAIQITEPALPSCWFCVAFCDIAIILMCSLGYT